MLWTGGSGTLWSLVAFGCWGFFRNRYLGDLTPGSSCGWIWLIVKWIIQIAFPEVFIFQRILRVITILPKDPLLIIYNIRQQERGVEWYARKTHIHLNTLAIGNDYNRMFGGNEVSLDPELLRLKIVLYPMLRMPVNHRTNKNRSGLLLLDAISNVKGTEFDIILG